ncbi:GNAT family N-acetyltransferase [Ningiella sp. W23]|uniref:GNAT family N-acetyltransferase n=1 Tax=Ningiella sp. W23 TaxID=3023715 RepID=UPI0037578CEC
MQNKLNTDHRQPFHCELVDYHNKSQTQALMALIRMYARDPMGGNAELSDTVADKLIAEMASRDFLFSLVLFSQNEALGFANCIESFSTFKAKTVVNIHDFAIVPGHRGKGLSQFLMSAIEVEAKKRHACKLTLEVLQGNAAAQTAYLKAGFIAYELDPELGTALFWEKPLT